MLLASEGPLGRGNDSALGELRELGEEVRAAIINQTCLNFFTFSKAAMILSVPEFFTA